MKAFHTIRVRLLVGGACLAALAGPLPVMAQEAAAPADDGVIYVTATKRQEDAQDVPIAITALDMDQISAAGIAGTEDLRAAVPALNVTTAVGGFGLPRIRGIGATGQGPSIENPVAVYVDGVYYTSAFGNLMSLSDVEQVAVLKGPQGTLFGRNATGGLIQITTRRPSFDFEASGRVGYANYDTVSGSAFVSGPLTDTLAVSVSGQYLDQQDGFGRNITTGNEVQTSETFTGRAHILWQPSDATEVMISGDIGGFSGANPAFRPVGLNTAGEDVQAIIAAAGGDPLYDIRADVDPSVRGRQWGGSLDIEHDFGGVSLHSISAYRDTKLRSFFDPDGRVQRQLVIDNNQYSEQYSQEINLISEGDGALSWVLGAYYLHEEAGLRPIGGTSGLFVFGNNGYRINVSNATLDSYSAFAEGTLALGENTNLTAGFRYTWDERDLERYTIELNRNITNAVPVQGATTLVDISNDEPSWRLSIDHRFSDALLAYASYNRGFRSGAFVVGRTPTGILTPEKIDAFEVGIKSDLADGLVRLNLAGYYYDQSSVQVMQIISGEQNVYNADGAEIWGLDADISINPTDNLRIFGGVNVTDAKYKSFTSAIIATPFPLPTGFVIPTGQTCLGTFGNPFTQVGGNCLLVGDASGNALQNTPDFTASIGFGWDIPTSVGTFTLDGNLYHNGGFPTDIDERVQQSSYNLVNAGLTWRDSRDTFYVRVWARNLTDEYYFSQLGASNTADNGYPGSPRTYGLEVGFDF